MNSTKLPSRLKTIGLMAGLMIGVFLTLMDQTVVSIALPSIAGQLNGLSLYAWVFSGYMLAQTAFLTIFGKLSDLYGRRLMFLIGVGLFMLGSILCGQAQTMEQLIIFRALQGVGGAGLMPIALAILGFHYGPRERARLQGILGSAAGLAVVVGPTVGSLVVENFSWRWVFYINLPLGILSAVLVVLFLRESRDTARTPSIDYSGAITLLGWVGSLMIAFFFSRDLPWSSPQILGLLGAFILFFVLFLFNESRAREPILPLHIFAHPTVAAASAVAFVRAVAFYALIIYVPLLVQGVLGGTPENARNALIAFAVPVIFGAVIAGFLVARNISYRTLLMVGLALFGVGLWLVSQLGRNSDQGVLLRDLVLAGFGVGITQVTIVLALQNSVKREHMGTASSLSQFLTNLAGTVGVGLLGFYQSNLLINRVSHIVTSATLEQLSPQAAQVLNDAAALGRVFTSPAAAAQLPSQLLDTLRGALENSLTSVFQVGLFLTAIALFASLFMQVQQAKRQTKQRRAWLLISVSGLSHLPCQRKRAHGCIEREVSIRSSQSWPSCSLNL
ncbi:MAG: MFS transporter [Chloroflexi bacterium]|nr:MFS transporter [Chloroflexota bacterium]